MIERLAYGVTVAVTIAACTADSASSGATAPVLPLSLTPDEIIVGRAHQPDRVWLLTDTPTLVTIRPRERTASSRQVSGLRSGEQLWGLATDGAGSLWTLGGRSTLVRIGPDAHIRGREPLPGHNLGIFGHGGALMVQTATLDADGALLWRIDSTSGRTEAIDGLRLVRATTRAETLARNLVACGSSENGDLPCWFAYDDKVARISRNGSARWHTLFGIRMANATRPEADQLEESGPIVDAHVDSGGDLWVLVRDDREPAPGLIAARYTQNGTLVASRRIDGAARLILDVRKDECLLLVGFGGLQEISMP